MLKNSLNYMYSSRKFECNDLGCEREEISIYMKTFQTKPLKYQTEKSIRNNLPDFANLYHFSSNTINLLHAVKP